MAKPVNVRSTRGRKVAPCSCEHEYQDKRFGAGKRLFNKLPSSKDAPERWRCTICEKII